MKRYRIAVGLAAGAAALVAAFVAPSAASADTVQSPIGTVTAEQYLGNYCDDFGAHVRVSVGGGLAGVTYTATGIGVFSGSATFVADGAGTGHVDLHNVTTTDDGLSGVTPVTVSAGGTTITVPAAISCQSQKGD
jgi:hypothetical protein